MADSRPPSTHQRVLGFACLLIAFGVTFGLGRAINTALHRPPFAIELLVYVLVYLGMYVSLWRLGQKLWPD